MTASPLHWSAELVGLPYRPMGRTIDGVDCWGLMVLAARMGGGLTFPSYGEDYASPDEYREIDAVVAREAASPLWQEVPHLFQARELDVMVFRRARWDRHTAMYVRPGVMLHIEGEGTTSRLDDYRHPDWAELLTGVYRYQGVGA